VINIIGTILNSSGYDCHTRNLGRALAKITDVRYTIGAVPGWEKMVDDKELEMIKKEPVEDEINLIITNPLYWRVNTQAKRNWAYMVWEGDKIPKCFIEECLNPEIEFIFVPSEHTKKAIENTFKEYYKFDDFESNGITYEIKTKEVALNKVKVMPHGVDLNLFYPKPKPKKCVFFVNKGFRNLEDRGGVQYALRAYFEEFTDKDDVEMLLKINPAYGVENFQKLIDGVAPRKEGLPLLNLNIDHKPYDKMVDMYNKCTVFVSPTRAESYNLPCIEAMACGLPVITTNFGGQVDFCNNKTGWIIGGKLEQVKHEIMYEECCWLSPSIQELRNALREAYSKPDRVLVKGKSALEIARKNTWDNTAKKIVDLI
jgi:glycosyltransferase involved in cell wall biosynthesis